MNNRGITLIEVMISILILAFGLLALAPMVVLSIEGNNISRDALEASNLAKEQIETFQNSAVMPTLPFNMSEPNLRGTYTRQTYIYDNAVDSLLPPNLCNMQVTISWTNKLGSLRSISYETMLEK
jgi:prepilin-type N-terminal cleavage/methylation domain-containing protein